MNNSGWIKVEDRLPEPYIHVLVYDQPEGEMGFARIKHNAWDVYFHQINVTHWQPLPQPPTPKSFHDPCPYGNEDCPTCNPPK